MCHSRIPLYWSGRAFMTRCSSCCYLPKRAECRGRFLAHTLPELLQLFMIEAGWSLMCLWWCAVLGTSIVITPCDPKKRCRFGLKTCWRLLSDVPHLGFKPMTSILIAMSSPNWVTLTPINAINSNNLLSLLRNLMAIVLVSKSVMFKSILINPSIKHQIL